MKNAFKVVLSVILVMTFAITSLGLASIAVKSIKANASNITLQVGKTCALKVTITPANATNKKLTYKSANTRIATVDKSGKIKGIKVGKTVITVTSSSNKKAKATCKVTVSLQVKKIQIRLMSRWIGSDANAPAQQQLVKDFNDKNQDIEIVDESISDGTAYSNKMKAAVATGNIPHVFQIWGEAHDYAKNGIIADLKPYFDEDKAWSEGFLPGIIDVLGKFPDLSGLYEYSIYRNPNIWKIPILGVCKGDSPCRFRWGAQDESGSKHPSKGGVVPHSEQENLLRFQVMSEANFLVNERIKK